MVTERRLCHLQIPLCQMVCRLLLSRLLRVRHVQGRGGSTGYDNAVALPARSDSDELQKENNKSVAALKGQAVFSIAKVGIR